MENMEVPKKITQAEMDRLYQERMADQAIKKSRELQSANNLEGSDAEELTRLERLVNLQSSNSKIKMTEKEILRHAELKKKAQNN